MGDFKVNGREFRSAKMPPRKQFHVVRRLGSLFGSVVSALSVKDKDPLLAATYIASAISRLSDSDADFILDACLSRTQMNQGGLWVDIMAPNGDLMFDEIMLTDMHQIVWEVLMDNFGPFMLGLVQKVSAGAKVEA